jgi:aspartyl-tRNA(Asn)/glutamyl-tRNA(Gln) amidotransferase subunit A
MLGAVELADAVAAGRQSPVELTDALLARIERQNPAARAYITITAASARAAARRIAARPADSGPLAGVPYAAKDLFETRGIATTGGSRLLEDWVPGQDAAAIERLAAAGAILVGKANLHELAHGATGENPRFGTPPNPWSPERLAGGSSSGSAAAVARGLASFALGSDTGGSIRVPAALCGVVGLKPTFGLVSRHGMIPYSWSLDHAGIIARDVADAALVLQVLAGHDPRDSASAERDPPDYRAALAGSVAGLRIGVAERFFLEAADAEILAATRACLDDLAAAGARLVPVALPDLGKARTVSLLVQMPEVLSYHRRHLPEKLDLYGADLRDGLAFGQFILAEHYVRAQRMIEHYRRQMRTVFAGIDALVTPTCPATAPPIGAGRIVAGGLTQPIGNALTRFTSFFNLIGAPALSVPSGLASDGLPMGVQIVGRPFEDDTVLRIGLAVERARGRLLDGLPAGH